MRTLQDYVVDLKRRHAFSYTKINHGFWERLIRIKSARAGGEQDSRKLDILEGGAPYLVEDGFLPELLDLLKRVPLMRGDFRFCVSPHAWPYSDRVTGTPGMGMRKVQAMIDRHVPPNVATEDPMLWKQAAIDGSIRHVIEALRERNVVLVGPPEVTAFDKFARLDKFRHYVIHRTEACAHRVRHLDEIRRDHRPELQAVYIIQAGTLAPWLILQLHEQLADATMIDLGMAIDLCNIRLVNDQPWSRVHRSDVSRTIVAINPSWPERPEAYGAAATSEPQRNWIWRSYRDGIVPEIADIAGVPARAPILESLDYPDLGAQNVAYIESKRVDWERVRQFLALSERANHWTNTGPVSLALERTLEFLLKVPANRAVVMCSSGTSALVALAGLHAVRAGRPLRWLASSYGFFSTKVAELANTVAIVDCDETGFLDLDRTAKKSAQDWDGLLVTNLFGLAHDLRPYREFCRERGKVLIVDNATAMSGYDRSAPDSPDEIISFHHTKPWGHGEGGCAIVNRDDAPLLRSIINFGVGAPAAAKPFAANGKISDLSCAAILERIERAPSWSHLYQSQAGRILKLVLEAGLRPFSDRPGNPVPISIAVLAKSPVGKAEIARLSFPVRKYYPPLDPDTPCAHRIFAHIVNVPCHPGMAAISSDKIREELTKLA